MPAIYAHKRFGERVFNALDERLQRAFAPYKECYYLGFEGPDILFYHKPFKTNETRKKGPYLHLRSAEKFFLSAAKKICSQAVDDVINTATAAYIAGFICHFCLDNACHPRVYELEFTGVSHGLIESEFDKYIMRQEGVKVFGNNPAKHIKNKNGAANAAASILEVEESEIKRAIKTIRFINGAFVCPFKFVHNIIHAFLNKIKMEDRYGGMLIHHEDDPACSKINAGLYDDLKNAVTDTAKLVTEYFDNVETTARTGVVNKSFDKNYTGGILDEHHQPICRNDERIGEQQNDPA